MITFDQLLETIVRDPATKTRLRKREDGFERIQGNTHVLAALFSEWKSDQLTNGDMIDIINLDGTDPELTTVKIHLNGLNKSQALALHDVMFIAETGVSGYDKSKLRTTFGLTA